ncbi:hypothetical protein [Clostridium sp.]|uniref:hypothetical protein n=1 Tax=Clostridium sp. TaxID=1506 RepID=UPI003217E1D7
MICRLVGEEDLEVLAEMRWQHKYEEDGSFEIPKDEFITYCKSFVKEGLVILDCRK